MADEAFDVNRDIVLPVILKFTENINDTNITLQENNYRIGFHEGFKFGVEEGYRRAQRDQQRMMGITPIPPYSEGDLYSEDFKHLAEGPVTSRGKSTEATHE